jgi:hypothetical protein
VYAFRETNYPGQSEVGGYTYWLAGHTAIHEVEMREVKIREVGIHEVRSSQSPPYDLLVVYAMIYVFREASYRVRMEVGGHTCSLGGCKAIREEKIGKEEILPLLHEAQSPLRHWGQSPRSPLGELPIDETIRGVRGLPHETPHQ